MRTSNFHPKQTWILSVVTYFCIIYGKPYIFFFCSECKKCQIVDWHLCKTSRYPKHLDNFPVEADLMSDDKLVIGPSSQVKMSKKKTCAESHSQISDGKHLKALRAGSIRSGGICCLCIWFVSPSERRRAGN